MISWAWGRRSIGKVRPNSSSSSRQPAAIWGDSDDVAQVSITSGSPTNPPAAPRWSGLWPGGTSEEGSTGSIESSGMIGREWSAIPSSSSGYQTGKGTPKKRWRLMHQSVFSPSTQFSYRARIQSGIQRISRPRCLSSSACSIVRTNH